MEYGQFSSNFLVIWKSPIHSLVPWFLLISLRNVPQPLTSPFLSILFQAKLRLHPQTVFLSLFISLSLSLSLFFSPSLSRSRSLSLSLSFSWSSYYLIFYCPTGQVVLTHACDEAFPSIFAIHLDLRSPLSAAISTPRRCDTSSLFFQSACHWFNHNCSSSFQSALIFSVLISSHFISYYILFLNIFTSSRSF